MPNHILQIFFKNPFERTIADNLELLKYWSSNLSNNEIRYATMIKNLFLQADGK